MEVETALMRLREATAEINRATDDHDMKATLAKTWLLQDRLVYPDRVCLSVLSTPTRIDLLVETRCHFKDQGSIIRVYQNVRRSPRLLANS